MKLKCRKCREYLLDLNCLVNSHGLSLKNIDEIENSCLENHKEPVWYIDYDTAPDWMKHCFDQGDWLKGKVFCPKCSGRLGSYNFVQPRKCACATGVAQPVWLIKSKVDVGLKPNIRQPKQVPISETWTIINDEVQLQEVLKPSLLFKENDIDISNEND